MRDKRSRTIILAGILAGVTSALLIDFYLVLTLAYGFHPATPTLIFEWDASNVLGR